MYISANLDWKLTLYADLMHVMYGQYTTESVFIPLVLTHFIQGKFSVTGSFVLRADTNKSAARVVSSKLMIYIPVWYFKKQRDEFTH